MAVAPRGHRAEAGFRVGGTDEVAIDRGFAPQANRHGVHVGHQQSPWTANCAGQLENQIADFTWSGRATMSGIENDG